MLIRIDEKIVNIVHNYVIRRLIAVEGVVYSGTITGPLDRIFNGTFGRQSHINLFDKAGGILYAIVHGHSFADGNKRTGLLTTYLFLLFNGFALHVPHDTTPFLEQMADAANPDAPTEKDAIIWVRKNSKRHAGPVLINGFLTLYCKLWGTKYIEYMTVAMLERDSLPYVDREKLVDRTLKEKTACPTICT